MNKTTNYRLGRPGRILAVLVYFLGYILLSCTSADKSNVIKLKVSVVNAPNDIVTLGAQYLAKEIKERSNGIIDPVVYHSGVLSGGKGIAEIEMCQQGSIEIHITSTAYLANLVPKMSLFSLPFLFRDMDQVIRFTISESMVLKIINQELEEKDLTVIAWWPRGFRQLTNSRRPVKSIDDLKGLKLRVMNNQLYVDNLNAMGANPVPMAWGEVYNGLQLKTIDGQENAEDVIFSSRLYETQKYMTVWDYSIDLEVVLVNLTWWKDLSEKYKTIIQSAADASIEYEEKLLIKNTEELRKKIIENGMEIHYLSAEEKHPFKQAVNPVWDKYKHIFSETLIQEFINELENH